MEEEKEGGVREGHFNNLYVIWFGTANLAHSNPYMTGDLFLHPLVTVIQVCKQEVSVWILNPWLHPHVEGMEQSEIPFFWHLSNLVLSRLLVVVYQRQNSYMQLEEGRMRQASKPCFFLQSAHPGLVASCFLLPDGYIQHFFSKCGQCSLLFIQIHNWTINDTMESPVSGVLISCWF